MPKKKLSEKDHKAAKAHLATDPVFRNHRALQECTDGGTCHHMLGQLPAILKASEERLAKQTLAEWKPIKP